VIVTGKDDVISDGTSTVIVSNGDALLGQITGVICLRFLLLPSLAALWDL
jgi:hydroxyethylthiazole kinase